jgi:hypothetical protein
VDGGFGYDVCVETVAEVNGIDVVTDSVSTMSHAGVWVKAYHSRSLYMMVKNTWRNRLTAFMSTARRYNHASPDILLFAYGSACHLRRLIMVIVLGAVVEG